MSSYRDTALEQDIKSLQSSLNEFRTSNHYYCTQELTNHIQHINNALDNIKLDQEFQRESKNWIKQFDVNSIQQNRTSRIFLMILSQNEYET
jgi:hypothetical protein